MPQDVDRFGMPLGFNSLPDDFYALIGRIAVIWGHIEFILDSIGNLHLKDAPPELAKVQSRMKLDTELRNALVHSFWVTAEDEPSVLLGGRLRKRLKTETEHVSIQIQWTEDSSEYEHLAVSTSLAELRKALRRAVGTQNIATRVHKRVISLSDVKMRLPE